MWINWTLIPYCLESIQDGHHKFIKPKKPGITLSILQILRSVFVNNVCEQSWVNRWWKENPTCEEETVNFCFYVLVFILTPSCVYKKHFLFFVHCLSCCHSDSSPHLSVLPQWVQEEKRASETHWSSVILHFLFSVWKMTI